MQRLLEPVSFDTIQLLVHSGWELDLILRLTVQQIKHLKNAPSASGPTLQTEPEYVEFARFSKLLQHLQREGLANLGYEIRTLQKDGESTEARVPVLHIAEAPENPEVQELRGYLKAESGVSTFPVLIGPGPVPRIGGIRLVTRSLLGAMFYLSQGVEVLDTDLQAGYVTVTRGPKGEIFDWRKVTGDLMRIRSAETLKEAASVAVKYRGHWFYIPDSDLDSKSSFALLSQLFSLQAGQTADGGPVLTLPVGG